MFRIHFNPKTGRFVIQIGCCLGLFWRTVQREVHGLGGEPAAVLDHEFDTYNEALIYATNIGIDTLYADRSANQFRAHMGR